MHLPEHRILGEAIVRQNIVALRVVEDIKADIHAPSHVPSSGTHRVVMLVLEPLMNNYARPEYPPRLLTKTNKEGAITYANALCNTATPSQYDEALFVNIPLISRDIGPRPALWVPSEKICRH